MKKEISASAERMATVGTRDVAMFNPLGMCDVSTTRTDLETVLNSYQQGVQFLIWGNDACSMDTCRFLQLSYLLHVYMDLPLVVTSTRFIMHHSPSVKLWTAFLDVLCCNNSETGCTCHVCVLWRWWWLYSALGALVCISWQMGCSAPLLLPVMMRHVPVYQTGHTQLSPHLRLSQSYILLPSVFLLYCTAHALSLLIYPTGKDPPPRPKGTCPSLLSNTSYICVHMEVSNSALVARHCCSTLGESQDYANNMVRYVNYHLLLMHPANICPPR